MEFKEIVKKAKEVRLKFEDYEVLTVGKKWNREQIMQGFIVDVGDLTRLVMAKEGHRKISNVDEKLKHELADCLWSLIILADKFEIDLESSFLDTMKDLDCKIEKKKV